MTTFLTRVGRGLGLGLGLAIAFLLGPLADGDEKRAFWRLTDHSLDSQDISRVGMRLPVKHAQEPDPGLDGDQESRPLEFSRGLGFAHRISHLSIEIDALSPSDD